MPPSLPHTIRPAASDHDVSRAKRADDLNGIAFDKIEQDAIQKPVPTFWHHALAWNSSAIAFGTKLAGRTAEAWTSSGAVAQLSLGRIGDLEVRLTHSPKEIRRTQRLRYRVFFEQRGVMASPASTLQRRDLCAFDAICDHLVVVDHASADHRFGRVPRPKIVGTYRLLRQDVARRHDGFYSAGEFDLAPLLARHPDKRFLELGRSCVLPRYRSKRTIELLWRGIWSYVQQHRIDVLIGCASFEGTDPDALVLPLSALHHHARAPSCWQVRPLPGRTESNPLVPIESLDRRHAMALLPPLIKGYVRAGARFADGVVVDHRFATTDVFAIMPMAELERRYLGHFGSA